MPLSHLFAITASQRERINNILFKSAVIYILAGSIALCISLPITLSFRDDGVPEPVESS
jgi:uncharacterized membrane protein